MIPSHTVLRLQGYEGRAVCLWLNQAGYHCALLEYRILRAHPGPLLDARRAVQLTRSNSAVWGVKRVVTLGFSAGAHLAGHLALSWNHPVGRRVDQRLRKAGDRAAAESPRPDGVVLAYPIIVAGMIGHVTALDHLARSSPSLPPPFFIWHTESDDVAPVNGTQRLIAALAARGASVEAHIFQGPIQHGLALARDARWRNRALGQWTALCLGWMEHSLGKNNSDADSDIGVAWRAAWLDPRAITEQLLGRSDGVSSTNSTIAHSGSSTITVWRW